MAHTPLDRAASASYCTFETPLGPIGVAWSSRGVVRLCLPEADVAATERRLQRSLAGNVERAEPPARIAEAIKTIQRYLAGERVSFDGVLLDLADRGAFIEAVYTATRAIPWGETATYGELARRAGAPGAAQAVGQAMGSNPVPLIVPCHRVLGGGGRSGGFSAYGGRMTKAKLLALEGVSIAGGLPLLPGL